MSLVRAKALESINFFAFRQSQALLNSVDSLLEQMDKLAEDFDPARGEDIVLQDGAKVNSEVAIQILICRIFVCLVEARPDKLQPSMGQLVEYIIKRQTSGYEILAREASEFWLAVGDHGSLWNSLAPHMLRVIPVLLECMVYSPEFIARHANAEDDAEKEDRPEDIRPHFAKTALRGRTNGGPSARKGNDSDMEEGELSDFSEDGDEDPDEEWTVRKCSAAALDVLARDFHDPVFESMLGYLETNLKSEQWPHREAAGPRARRCGRRLHDGRHASSATPGAVPHQPPLRSRASRPHHRLLDARPLLVLGGRPERRSRKVGILRSHDGGHPQYHARR